MTAEVDRAARRWKLIGAGTLLAGAAKGCLASLPRPKPVLRKGTVHSDGRARAHHQSHLLGEDRPLAAERARLGLRPRACGGRQLHHRKPRHLRLLELQLFTQADAATDRNTFHRFAETHTDKMGVARTVAEARAIVASGRMAVFSASESGFDHEGDPDVLAAFYRLGLRSIQFATQSGFNAFSDSALAATQGGQTPDHYHGINERGRAAGAADERARHPDRHHAWHGGRAPAADRGEPRAGGRQPRRHPCRQRSWLVRRGAEGVGCQRRTGRHPRRRGRRFQALPQMDGGNPAGAANAAKAVTAMVGFAPSAPRPPGDRGDYIAKVDEEFADRWKGLQAWREDPGAALPTAEEWAERVDYVIKTVGAGPRWHWVSIWWRGVAPCRRHRPAIRICLPSCEGSRGEDNVRKIAGENWLRVLAAAKDWLRRPSVTARR